MSKNNEMKYEDIIEEYENIGVPNASGYQAFSKEKTKDFVVKCISAVLIASGLVTTISGCKKNNNTNVIPTTAIVSDGEAPETFDFEYVLETPFANGEEKQIVDSINKNNKKDATIRSKATVRMIKFFNGTLTKDDFKGMSDKEIIKEIRYYFIDVFNVLSPTIEEFKSLEIGAIDKYNKNIKAVAFTLFDKNSYVYQTYLKNYDGSVLNEQKSDIVNKNTADYKINAEEYGKLGKKMLTDKKISVYEKALVAIILKADYPLFARHLSKEYKEFYSKEFDSSYFTQAMNDFFNKYAIATDVYDADCDKKTREGESYNEADTQRAAALAGSTGEKGRTEKGGKKIGTSSEVIQKSKDTGSYSSSTVVNKDKETTKTETKQGGKVVDEEVVTKPPKVIDEEDVQPGYDPIESSTYTEDEWKRRNESSSKTTTTTTTKQEENNSSDDIEFEETLTEDEWRKYLGVGQMGLGVSLTPIVKALKKRRK